MDRPDCCRPLSRLPNELLLQIMRNISDRATHLHVYSASRQFYSLINDFKWDFVSRAFTEEVIRRQHTLIISIIASRINEHPKSALKLFEGALKDLFSARKWECAYHFLFDLHPKLGKEHRGMLEQPLHNIYQEADTDGLDSWQWIKNRVKRAKTRGNYYGLAGL